MTIKENTPLVSVVMATYNEPEDIIKKSILSILEQTFADFELIIIDDSTNNETIKMIDSFTFDKRLKIVRRSERIGFVKSLNIGLQQAKGKYIARMDGDDISISNRLELQLKYLEEHPLVSVLGGSMYIIDDTDQVLSDKKYPTSEFLLNFYESYRNPLAHPTVMMRKECVENGFFYDESFDKAEDLELWLRLKKSGYVLANLPVFLLKYRINGDLSLKRKHDNWEYNYKARKKNFNYKTPIFSMIGLAVSYLYTKLPKSIIRAAYYKENNNKID